MDVHTICSLTHATHQPQPFELLMQSCHCRVDKVFRASGGKSQDRCFIYPPLPSIKTLREDLAIMCALRLQTFFVEERIGACVCVFGAPALSSHLFWRQSPRLIKVRRVLHLAAKEYHTLCIFCQLGPNEGEGTPSTCERRTQRIITCHPICK